MAMPRKVAIFTGVFGDIGLSTEFLQVSWNYLGSPGNRVFLVGTDIFLENPSTVSQIPDQQLLASASMMAILAGGVSPGTKEYLDAIVNQEVINFQTIIGTVKLKTVTSVIDASVGALGTVFDVEFQKVGASTNVKTVRSDAHSFSQYDNRVNNPSVSIDCIAGAIHKELGLKKSQLGAAESANRDAVISYISTCALWV